MSINELFDTKTNGATVSSRSLSGTAELTRISQNAAVRIIREMEEQIDDYREKIAKSANDSKAMDDLLEEFRPWVDIDDESELRHLDDATVEGMLKSQQSKRSRTKGKTMTLDNYTTLMTATIAEHILRELYNKPKSASFANRRAGIVDYTPAELEAYAEDQEALRREIRNIQSKKSIMKSKEGFDESSEQWQALLKAEMMLKDLRVGGHSSVVEVDTTKNQLKEKLAEVNIEDLDEEGRAELLASIQQMIAEENK